MMKSPAVGGDGRCIKARLQKNLLFSKGPFGLENSNFDWEIEEFKKIKDCI